MGVREVRETGRVRSDQGEPGKSVCIKRSRDLVNWEPVATVPIPATGQTPVDPAAALEPFLLSRAGSGP